MLMPIVVVVSAILATIGTCINVANKKSSIWHHGRTQNHTILLYHAKKIVPTPLQTLSWTTRSPQMQSYFPSINLRFNPLKTHYEG
jgi:hypothetical protein